tara:strand:- start:205 stop:900 length:696 start_codon:yes stop_codon:yes gene_type:complete
MFRTQIVNKQELWNDVLNGFTPVNCVRENYTLQSEFYQDMECLAVACTNKNDPIPFKARLIWTDVRSVMHNDEHVVVHTSDNIYSFQLPSTAAANLLYVEILQWSKRVQYTGEQEPNSKGFYDHQNRQIKWVTDIGIHDYSGEQILAKEKTRDVESHLFKALFKEEDAPEANHIHRHLSDFERMKMCVANILDKLVDDEDASYWLPDISSDEEFEEDWEQLSEYARHFLRA